MSKQFRIWHVITISIDSEFHDPVSNRCMELGSTGVEINGTKVVAYFPGESNVNEILSEL